MPSFAITGASKGIGREFVRQLAADPSNMVIAIVRDPNGSQISKLFSESPNVHLVKGDVTDPTSMIEAAATTASIAGGQLDVLIHNSNSVDQASMGLSPTQMPFDAQAIKAMFEPPLSTAIYGGMWATNAFLPLIEKGVQKKIVHISSGMGDLELIRRSGISAAIPYSIAKAGMNVQVAKYAVELAPKGVKVLALSPGWVDTWEGKCGVNFPANFCSSLIDAVSGPKPPQMIEAIQAMLKSFQAIEPDLKGQIQPEESVRKCLQVIKNLSEKESGLFMSQNGDQQSWF